MGFYESQILGIPLYLWKIPGYVPKNWNLLTILHPQLLPASFAPGVQGRGATGESLVVGL